MKVGKDRKTRSDKKKEVQSIVTIELKDEIYRLSRLTRTPVKTVCEILTNMTINDRTIIEKLSPNFQHDYRFENTILRGNLDTRPINKRIIGKTGVVSMTFYALDYDNIYRLAFALSVSPSRMVAVLLHLAMSDVRFVNQYIEEHLKHVLYKHQLDEIKRVLEYVNRNSPNPHSWSSFLAHILNTKGTSALKMKEIVRNFLSNK